MKRSLCAPPDLFSAAPLVALLPVRGDLKKLEALSSFVFARYERVESMLREFDGTPTESRILESELAMLKQVLEWLDIDPQGRGDE